tara:strand:+ start:617 stop:1696 length:1080 start_codon:yes stop_codon:yes gene_type:complete
VLESDKSVFVIAEVGVNHNGDPNLAAELVDIAREVGADAVKFQTFAANALVTATAEKARYQKTATKVAESQRKMLERLQLDVETHFELMRQAQSVDLHFMSTAFDSKSLEFLVKELDLPILKIPSGEITNGPLLLEFARTGRELIVSTGMSSMEEVQTALSVLAFGLVGTGQASMDAFSQASTSEKGQAALRSKVTLLHCTTQYPAPPKSVNLQAMVSMGETFGLKMGYSDHTPGTAVACAAVALGARVIEKHITKDKRLTGPDHAASLNPEEFRILVEAVRTVEHALGDGVKIPHKEEIENIPIARKSLVAARSIAKGEHFSPANVTAKRPGDRRSPMEYWDLMGQIAERNYDADDWL